jgi:hypothetical protein
MFAGCRRASLAMMMGALAAGLVGFASLVQAGEPSPAYRESLRRTLELRRQRQRLREAQPVGQIFMYPMPPSLIIRHTPEVHDEIRDLLRVLRY